ncbi:SEC-C metal-binding domain-containing protein [candidate division KSB1 bacterium]
MDIDLEKAQTSLRQLFEELNIQSSFGRTIAILLGGHCYPDYISMDIIYPKIYNQKDVIFDSMEQANNLTNTVMGLWNYLVTCNIPEKFEFLQFKEDIENYVGERTNEIREYLDVVLLNGISDINSYTDKSQIEIDFIREEHKNCEKILSGKDNISSLDPAAIQTRVVEIWKKMFAVKQYQTEDRQRSIKEGSYQSRIIKRKVGRNEPCFCGSGKKYKHCCLN